jgi:hypothetical protein
MVQKQAKVRIYWIGRVGIDLDVCVFDCSRVIYERGDFGVEGNIWEEGGFAPVKLLVSRACNLGE